MIAPNAAAERSDTDEWNYFYRRVILKDFKAGFEHSTVNKALDDYRFHEAAGDLYHFFWDEFCSWYIELSKSAVTSEDPDDRARAARRAAFAN